VACFNKHDALMRCMRARASILQLDELGDGDEMYKSKRTVRSKRRCGRGVSPARFPDCSGILFFALFCLVVGGSLDSHSPAFRNCSWDALRLLRGQGADERAMAATRRLLQDGLSCAKFAAARATWADYTSLHRPVAARIATSGGAVGPRDAILVCRPFFGLGNRLNALAACAYTALATNRTLIVDWSGQDDDPDAAGASAPIAGLTDLLGADVFWQLTPAVLSDLLSQAAHSGDLVEVRQTDMHATHTPQLLCERPSAAFGERVLLLKTHRWLPFVATNPHNRHLLARLGLDSIEHAAAALGSTIFRPSPVVAEVAAALLALLPGHVVAVQVREGAISGDGSDVRYPQSRALMRFVECAFAHLPPAARQPEARRSFFIASDSLRALTLLTRRIAQAEGGVVSSYGAGAMGWTDSPTPPPTLVNPLESPLEASVQGQGHRHVVRSSVLQHLQHLRPAVVSMASGAVVAVLTADLARGTVEGGQRAAAEMWALAVADQTIVTEDSTFATLATHLVRTETKTVAVVTNAGRCYSLPLMAPVSEAGLVAHRFASPELPETGANVPDTHGLAEGPMGVKGGCFHARMLEPSWLWSPPPLGCWPGLESGCEM
jgi:hypothetical protein